MPCLERPSETFFFDRGNDEEEEDDNVGLIIAKRLRGRVNVALRSTEERASLKSVLSARQRTCLIELEGFLGSFGLGAEM